MLIPAKDVKVGQRLKLDGGSAVRVSANKVTRGFRMAIEGHGEAYARMIVFADGRSYELFHPEERVEVVV